LAGKNVANPIATILSAAMMLDWLGERHNDPAARDAAVRIDSTVASLLANGKLKTADQGGTSSTSEVAAVIAAAILQSSSPDQSPSTTAQHTT
jgi:3-isopropylmalate dehydrogenase